MVFDGWEGEKVLRREEKGGQNVLYENYFQLKKVF